MRVTQVSVSRYYGVEYRVAVSFAEDLSLRLWRPSRPPFDDLIAAIGRFIDAWNDRCAPFTWTKDPDTIIAKATDPRHHKTQLRSDTEH